MKDKVLIQTKDGNWKVIPRDQHILVTLEDFPVQKKKRKKVYSRNEETYKLAYERANYMCEDCSISYHIFPHHLDGNHENHVVNNLRIVCWSCHSKYLNSSQSSINPK